MRSQSIWAIVALVVNTVAALPKSSSLQVFETLRNHVPRGWTKREKPDPSMRLHLTIALRMPDYELFEQTISAISTPGHPSYGQHLSRTELRSLVDPTRESIDSVLSWLKTSKVPESDIEYTNEWIKISISVADAENLLDTTFYNFTLNADISQRPEIRTLKVSLPVDILPFVSMIQPTTRFSAIKAQGITLSKMKFSAAVNPDAATSCGFFTNPDCLRELYGVGNWSASPDVSILYFFLFCL
jgi:tripeptidyl-peptidase-1